MMIIVGKKIQYHPSLPVEGILNKYSGVQNASTSSSSVE